MRESFVVLIVCACASEVGGKSLLGADVLGWQSSCFAGDDEVGMNWPWGVGNDTLFSPQAQGVREPQTAGIGDCLFLSYMLLYIHTR